MKVLATIICLLVIVSASVRAVKTCQLDENTRLMLENLTPLVYQLGVGTLKTKDTIVKSWLKNRLYELSDIQFTSVLTAFQNVNKTTPLAKLEVSRRILNGYIPHITKFKRQLGAFSSARDVSHHFQEIKWVAKTIVNTIQIIQSVLRKPSQTSTVFIRPTTSAVVNASSSLHDVRASVHSSTTAVQMKPSATTLTLHSIALRAYAMLEDLYSSLLEVQKDVFILAKTLC